MAYHGGGVDWADCGACALDVTASEFVVATADRADVAGYERLRALLARVRNAFGVDAVFVSEWTDGEPLARCVQGGCTEGANALQELYGRQLLGRSPARGALFRFDTVPVVTREGMAVGTLCGRHAGGGQQEGHLAADALRSVARLIAQCFEAVEPALH